VETTGPVNSTAFLASNPLRLELDLSGISMEAPLPQLEVRGTLIRRVAAVRLPENKILRIEAELLQPVSFELIRQGKRVSVNLRGVEAPLATAAAENGGSVDPDKARPTSNGEERSKGIPARVEKTQAPASAEEKKGPRKEPVQEEAPTGTPYTGSRISLDFQDADLIGVLRLIAEVSGLNIITTPEVSGKLSLRLINVPWDQALDIILRNANLTMVREGNVIRIAPKARLAQEREEALRAQKAEQQAEELVTRILPVSYADTKELVSNIKPLLTDRGTVQVDSRTSTLIIKDVERVLGDVSNLVKTLDRQTPQVSIEAKVVEVSRDFSRELGIQWGVTYTNRRSGTETQRFPRAGLVTGGAGAASIGSVTPGVQGADIVSNLGVSSATTPAGGQYLVNLPAAVGTGSGGALGILLGSPTLDPLVLAAQLSAAEATGKGRILSNPKITTLDNKEASIEQGRSIPYETTSAEGTKTEFIDATLKLTVTPHITAENTVSMKIKVTKNAPNTSVVGASGAPSIDKKEATTEVLVRDGETTVIGGIFTSDQSSNENKVPGLGDIPLLGWLFKKEKKIDNTTELLIFITPRIIRSR